MTTNDATPRERIAGTIQLTRWQAGNDIAQADAVIRHLWDRAESEEVVEAVTEAIRVVDHRMVSNVAIAATLTALLGPKPEGESDESSARG